jgi:gamma-glutamyl:cysteine ligase YbdK (ATP-grasp superfamily)
MEVPQWLKQNIGWSAVCGMGFLFVFYVNATYVDASELELRSGGIEQKLDKVLDAITAESEQRQFDMKVERVRDQIHDASDEIRELRVYIEEDPNSSLKRARTARLSDLTDRKEKLQTDLNLLMQQAPNHD